MQHVSATYRHADKTASPGGLLALPTTRLKWYGIAREQDCLTTELEAEGRSLLEAEVAAGRLALADDVGFVLLHYCTSVTFLIVAVWRNDNELWKTVYLKDMRGGPFEEQRLTGVAPAFCVWELAVVAHEQKAWIRFLRTDRTEAALQRYLADCYVGAV